EHATHGRNCSIALLSETELCKAPEYCRIIASVSEAADILSPKQPHHSVEFLIRRRLALHAATALLVPVEQVWLNLLRHATREATTSPHVKGIDNVFG